jgi:hypothetical protein
VPGLSPVTCGRSALRFKDRHNPDGSDLHYDEEARQEARVRRLTDRTLSGFVNWYSNTWFAVVNESWAEISDETPLTWTEGMLLLERVACGEAGRHKKGATGRSLRGSRSKRGG